MTGRHYRHYIELTLFGRRLMAVNEWFVDGHARLELPFGASEGAKVDQGANLALWAEAVWAPSVWVTRPDVRWEPIDANNARLVVPFGDDEQTFTVQFDPGTGLLSSLRSLRYKGAQDRDKTSWINKAVLIWRPTRRLPVVGGGSVTPGAARWLPPIGWRGRARRASNPWS